jgi:lambda family phage minor tail protein L
MPLAPYADPGYWDDGYAELVDYPAWYSDPDYWASGYAVDDLVIQLNAELQSAAPSAIIELFQLELNLAQHGINETHYFHSGSNLNGSGQVIWAGQSYQRWPIEATGFEYSGGQLPRPTLRVANVMGTITALILTLPNGLEGAKVSRIRTLARYLDGANFPGGVNPLGTSDPAAEWPREVFYIDRKATENIEVVEFELCAVFDLAGVRAPKRQCISNICQWAYRGLECTYAGNAYFDINDNPVSTLAQDICGKRLSSCEARFQQQRITGSVTAGSNVITLSQATSLSTGEPVSGFALPAGTTVSSVAGNLVTVSQSATGTTSVARTGTLQANYSTIVLSSAAGIIPGMSVTGTYLPANAQVVSVAGNTVTLSSPADLAQFFTAVATAAGNIPQERSSVYFATTLSSLFTIDSLIASPILPVTARARITGFKDSTFTFGKNVVKYKIATLSVAASNTGEYFWTIYNETTPASATYTFSATSQTYTFRADSTLPYGSYPGIGTFFT